VPPNGIVPGAPHPSDADPPLLQWTPATIQFLETLILLRMNMLDVEMVETACSARLRCGNDICYFLSSWNRVDSEPRSANRSPVFGNGRNPTQMKEPRHSEQPTYFSTFPGRCAQDSELQETQSIVITLISNAAPPLHDDTDGSIDAWLIDR
jgi:hypothetical protein